MCILFRIIYRIKEGVVMYLLGDNWWISDLMFAETVSFGISF